VSGFNYNLSFVINSVLIEHILPGIGNLKLAN